MRIEDYGIPKNPGAKLIKISTTDQNGNDLTSILLNLQSVTVKPLNGPPVTYNITSTVQKPSYFLYQVYPNPTDINGGFESIAYFNPGVEGFVSSDYDVTYGYADFPQFSSRFMDVDYGWIGGINTPVNFYTILNGTADRAPVQDSNYTSYAWSNIRYNGSRISSRDFNVPF
jgi:hypothetical protein